MSAAKSTAGNNPPVSLEDAAFAALSPEGGRAQGAADSGAHHEYVAIGGRSGYESGMMGDSVSAAQAAGNRQQHGQAHAAGMARPGMGLFNHGVLGMAGGALGDSEGGAAGDNHVGHLALGGAENADKKPGAAATGSRINDIQLVMHDEVDMPVRIAAVVDHHDHAVQAAAGDDHSWNFIHEIPHPEGVHKIAPIVDSAHEIAARDAADLFGSRDSFGAIVVQDMPAAAPAPVADAAPPAGSLAPDDNSSSLGGKAEPGSRISLYDNGALVGSVVADGDGNWNVAPQLAGGAHQLTAMAADADGNLAQVSNVRIVIAEQDEQQPDDAEPIVGNGFNAGLVPELMQGDEFAALDFNSLSLAPLGVGQHSAVSEHAAFALPDDELMQVEDAGDSGLLKFDSAGQVFDLNALIQPGPAPAGGAAGGNLLGLALGDVLEQGGKDLFAADAIQAPQPQGAALSLDDLLAADVTQGEIHGGYLPATQGIDWMQYGIENHPAS